MSITTRLLVALSGLVVLSIPTAIAAWVAHRDRRRLDEMAAKAGGKKGAR
jgi:hypothetical protein